MNHNRPIFHCQCCGAVVLQEAFRLLPFCCGHEMIKAGEESLEDDFAHELDIEPEFARPRLAPRRTMPEQEQVAVST